MKSGFSVNDPVDQVVVDRDCVFAQVNIAFGNAGTFCYTHSCSKERSHDGEPMAVCRGLGNKTQEMKVSRKYFSNSCPVSYIEKSC